MAYSADLHYGDLPQDKYVLLRYDQNFSLIRKKLESKECNILDVGGYCGDLFNYIKSTGFDVSNVNYHILDYDDTALDIAKKRGITTYKIDFNYDEIDKIVGDKKFDVIVCTEVLEHLLDPARHISKFPKLLKDDGVCLISLPNENTIFHRLYSLFGLGIDQCAFELYKHLHFPTIKMSRAFVSKYFDISKEKYYMNFSGKGSRLGFFGVALKIVPDWAWKRLTSIAPTLLARGVILLGRNK